MSDPKQPVDPLAATHAELPQQPRSPYAPQPMPQAPPYAQQLAAHQQARQLPTHAPAPQRAWGIWIIAAITVTAGAGAIAFAVTRLSGASRLDRVASGDRHLSGGSAAPGSAALGSAAPVGPVTGSGAIGSGGAGSAQDLTALVAPLNVTPSAQALMTGKRLAADVFTFGVDANEVGTGPDAAAKIFAHDLEGATDILIASAKTTIRNGAHWGSEIVRATFPTGTRELDITEVYGTENGVSVVRAWHIGRPVPDRIAYAAAQAGTLPLPTRLDDLHDVDVENAVIPALSSHDAYVAMMSTDSMAFSFGSAGEALEGPRAKAGFRAMNAEFWLHDGLRVVRIAPNFAWAAANVDFKNKFGVETFRVLLALARDDANGPWQIIQGHWSNGFPIPGAP